MPGPSFSLERPHPAPIAGVDEAGRGPLAGPVVAAAVILDRRRVPRGIDETWAVLTDVVGTKAHGQGLAFVRPMFQAKLYADVIPEGPQPCLVSFQVGTFKVDALKKASVTQGAMVALSIPNSTELVLAALAAWKLGAVPIPMPAGRIGSPRGSTRRATFCLGKARHQQAVIVAHEKPSRSGLVLQTRIDARTCVWR